MRLLKYIKTNILYNVAVIITVMRCTGMPQIHSIINVTFNSASHWSIFYSQIISSSVQNVYNFIGVRMIDTLLDKYERLVNKEFEPENYYIDYAIS